LAAGSYAIASGAKTSRWPCAITLVEVAKSSVTPAGTPRNSERRME
jgi:hypothetical protein